MKNKGKMKVRVDICIIINEKYKKGVKFIVYRNINGKFQCTCFDPLIILNN